eukprot:Plantae.Rhodophyta-Palmaria_palmata.ctg24715.p1 GENE.Plantae.Rhodophyta-Palmaria_palmata.ctg24715~~Plantae.Rhodophyta-Palmaria_palmata.ctg24715.p1  ORF type:complete len:124 (+),score=27.53 Plantae.Rhodophyta-Palmaria_palmata.ctg24715:463-834(+)
MIAVGERSFALGVDNPDISAEVLKKAFETLCERDAVIGLSMDGGYYQPGMKEPMLGVFDGFEWDTTPLTSSSTVLEKPEAIFRMLGFSWDKLAVLRDIDLPEYLDCFHSIVKSNDADMKVRKR